MARIRVLAVGLLALATLLAPAAPAAAAVCPSVFVPEGYSARCEGAPGDQWRLEVTHDGQIPLKGLSRMTVRPVEPPVDPFSWLQEQMVVDLSALRFTLDEALDDPRNPLGEMIPRDVLDPMLEKLGLLGHLPLRGCAYPFELEQRDAWQIDCSWKLGPFEQIARLQLVDLAGDPHLDAQREAPAPSAGDREFARMAHLTAPGRLIRCPLP